MRPTDQSGSDPVLPGPGPLPLFGWRGRALRMMRDPGEYFLQQYARFGQLSTWERKTRRHVFAFGPTHVRAVLGGADTFVADAFRAVRMPTDSSFFLLSNGLLRLNGAEHRQHRRLMQPAFTPRRVLEHRDAVLELTERQLSSWQVGQTRDMHGEFTQLIMLIAMRSVFDMEAPAEIERLRRLIGRLLKVATSPMTLLLPADLPGTTMHRAVRICDQIEAILRDLVRRRQPTAHERRDMLSTMCAARDENGARLTEDQLVSEAYTALCQDSSTATLTWALFLLDNHPDVLRDTVDELRGELHGDAPDPDQLDRLPLLDAVLKETMRLLPPAPMILRYTSAEVELDSYALPANAMVFLSPYVTHRIDDLYPEPLRFNPYRWQDMNRSTYEYLPFGGGVHSCIGRHFAMLEMKIVLATLLQRFRPCLVPGTPVNRAMRVSMVPSHGMPMSLQPVGKPGRPAEVSGTIRNSVDLTDGRL